MNKIHHNNRGRNQTDFKERPWTNKEWFKQEYMINRKSINQIAREQGVAQTTTNYWRRKFGFPVFNDWMKNERNPKWNGGRQVLNNGYIGLHTSLISDKEEHRVFTKGRSTYVLEHVYNMERYLGRKLEDGECVHHKNGIKDDNRIENLQLMFSNSEHITLEGKVGLFAKRLIWGDILPHLNKVELQMEFKKFRKQQ